MRGNSLSPCLSMLEAPDPHRLSSSMGDYRMDDCYLDDVDGYKEEEQYECESYSMPEEATINYPIAEMVMTNDTIRPSAPQMRE